jgi:TonB family protein
MKIRLGFLALGLAALLLVSGTTVRKASGQDAAPAADNTVNRKIRTKVVPEYPTIAKEMNVRGKVKIEATIAADGHVLNTRAIGGSPLLVMAAVEALKKWRFEPAPKDSTEIIEFEFGTGN